jgi:Tfp pilus assembly protein PilZ
VNGCAVKRSARPADTARVGADGRDRRKLKRVIKRIPVRFSTASARAGGHIKNLSKEGVFVRSNVLPMRGDAIEISFETRDGRKIEVAGDVRWTTAQMDNHEAAQPGFGVQLREPSAEYMEFFEEILLR